MTREAYVEHTNIPFGSHKLNSNEQLGFYPATILFSVLIYMVYRPLLLCLICFAGVKFGRKSNTLSTVSLHIVFTVRLHVMQRTVLLSEFCLSVRLSVRQMRVL